MLLSENASIQTIRTKETKGFLCALVSSWPKKRANTAKKAWDKKDFIYH
jgi:hypothetical protein